MTKNEQNDQKITYQAHLGDATKIRHPSWLALMMKSHPLNICNIQSVLITNKKSKHKILDVFIIEGWPRKNEPLLTSLKNYRTDRRLNSKSDSVKVMGFPIVAQNVFCQYNAH